MGGGTDGRQTTDVLEPGGVVRIMTFSAQPGHADDLRAAARGNATEAGRAPGCLSAEVCADPDDPQAVLVISRWASPKALQDFLDWHEGLAHGAVAGHILGAPTSVHHPVIG